MTTADKGEREACWCFDMTQTHMQIPHCPYVKARYLPQSLGVYLQNTKAFGKSSKLSPSRQSEHPVYPIKIAINEAHLPQVDYTSVATYVKM